MAGHSHWAGIKHKKGKADKARSNLFSKLSREITVAAKLGDKNPDMNARLRSAIQSARSSNMPKDNIQRAIEKSENSTDSNYENIRYEGFGPKKIAVIVETLTNNKNRTAAEKKEIEKKVEAGRKQGFSQGVMKANIEMLLKQYEKEKGPLKRPKGIKKSGAVKSSSPPPSRPKMNKGGMMDMRKTGMFYGGGMARKR